MHLFFYGVLLQGSAVWPILRGLGPGRAATTRGALYALPDPLGWYPALIPGDGAGAGLILGRVHRAGEIDLGALDAFEGADYVRRPVPVAVEGQSLWAEAYVWAMPLPLGAEPIVHGDFSRWLSETGRAPYRGP
ncbi:MAG: gamma-glutamylcyclotransferase [Erythrobacter cryptus]